MIHNTGMYTYTVHTIFVWSPRLLHISSHNFVQFLFQSGDYWTVIFIKLSGIGKNFCKCKGFDSIINKELRSSDFVIDLTSRFLISRHFPTKWYLHGTSTLFPHLLLLMTSHVPYPSCPHLLDSSLGTWPIISSLHTHNKMSLSSSTATCTCVYRQCILPKTGFSLPCRQDTL